MKSYIIYQMVSFSMTLDDHQPRFQGHTITQRLVCQTIQDKAIITVERQQELVYNLSNGAISITLFNVKNLQNDIRQTLLHTHTHTHNFIHQSMAGRKYRYKC